MNEQLKREEDDLCGKRGLEPNSERQTFEVEVPSKFREQYEDVVRPLRQADIQQQRRNVPNNPMGKHYPWDRELGEQAESYGYAMASKLNLPVLFINYVSIYRPGPSCAKGG